MFRLPFAILGVTLAAATFPDPVAAQSPAATEESPAATEIIKRLRGIRRPVDDTAPGQPTPSLSPATPASPSADPVAINVAPRLPAVTQPGTVQAGIGQPGSSQPGSGQPGFGQPGTVQAGVVQPPVIPPPMATTAPADVPAISLTVQFASGSWAISPTAERALVPLGQALSSPQLSTFRFRIEGHTDTVGADTMNRDLSQRRAEAVRAYLVNKFSVPADRLEAVGLGEAQLLIPTPDNMPEARNRRVQVLNLGS